MQLKDILITDELSRRSARQPNLYAENQAMRSLARQLTQEPEQMLQRLVELAVELCDAGSAGVSLLETQSNGEEVFRWVAMAGLLKPYVGDCTPGNFSPCQVCLEQGSAVLFAYPERYFTYFQALNMPLVESLMLPSIAEGQAIGTIWIITHDRERQFDGEDVRLMTSLADFTATLLRSQQQSRELLLVSTALRQSEARLATDLVGMQRLYELYATLNTGIDLQTALQEILAVACEFTHTDRGCVQLLSDDGTRLEMAVWQGYADDSPFINHFRYEGFDRGCDTVRVERQRFVIEETIGYPGLENTEAGSAVYADGIRAAQSTPIINRSGKAIGVLSTQFYQPHRSTDDEFRLVDLLAWTAADFIERYRTITALSESEAKYRSLFNSIDQGFCVIEMLFDEGGYPIDYLFLEVNPAFERQTGLINAVGKRMLELEPEHENYWFEIYARVAVTGEPIRFENQAAQLNRWYNVYAFRTGEPQEHKVAVLFEDISDRKQGEAERDRLLQQTQSAREEAERANRIKDEFLAILSHELRSPLNPILGWSNLLQSKPFDPATIQRGLSIIERNATLQTQLIDDLLDVSRILRGKLSLEAIPVNLTTVIEAAMEVVKTAARAKSIALQFDRSETCLVRGDGGRLQQVVWNLLSNAVKFTPNGGRIDVRLETLNDWAQITVTDTGQGISSDFMPYLFQSFRQEDASVTRQHGGLGLGLAIVKYLVDAHGGQIATDSPGLGQGATFTVQLPLLQEASAAPIAPTSADVDLTGLKVLIVDDSEDTRELLDMALSAYGAETHVAASGTEVLADLTAFDPDVLICDIGMPDMDGYTLLRQIRALPNVQGKNILAIALTSFAREEDRKQAIASGFQQHVAKPIVPEMLARAIAQQAMR